MYKRYALALGIFGLLAEQVHATPYRLQYGGRIVNGVGRPLSGPVQIGVNFYSSASDTTVLATMSFPSVPLNEGVFSLNINLTPEDFHTIFSQADSWIEITDMTNGKTYPRQRFAAVPYAFRIPVDPTTLGYTNQGQLTVLGLKGSLLPSAAPADGQLLKWQGGTGWVWGSDNTGGTPGAVDSTAIQDNSISNADIAASAAIAGTKVVPNFGAQNIVTTGTISGDGSGLTNLPAGPLGSSIDSSEIQDGSIVNADIAAAAAIAMSKIDGLSTALAAREPAFAGGTAAQYLRGDKSWETLDTSIIPENTNLYFTDARARAAVSATAPLSYNSGTGAFSMPAATSVANGYLSSGDWLTFNSKQAAITAASTLNAGSLSTALQSGLEIKPYGSVAGEAGELRFSEVTGAGNNYIGFRAPDSIAANRIWTLPPADGTGGQVLSTNGSGVLSWSSLAGGGSVTSVTAGTGLNGGTITGSGTIDLANTAVTPGSYSRASITVDAQGRLTAASSGSSIDLAADVTGTLPLAQGGTGATTAPLARTALGLGSLATASAVVSADITDGTIVNDDIAAGAAIAQSKISGLGAALTAKEDAITAGTTAQFWRGDKSWQTLDTSIVPENTNLYFTDARARAAVSGTAPLSYNSGTGAFSMAAATSVANGYLSSGDWLTFNSKQGAISAASTVNTGTLTTALQNGIELKPFGTDPGETGEIRFNELVANGSEYIGFKAPNAIGTTRIWTLPGGDGTNGQVLSTNGTGTLSWISPGGGGTVTSITAGTGLSGGTITGSGTIDLANTAVSPGAYVRADITVDAQGRITAAGNGSNVDLSSEITGVLPLSNGGTGATTAALARSALSAASSGANSDITSITGLTTALNLTQGGTGATTAALARSALSAASSGANSDITSITGLTTALSLTQGGTGATTAALARSALSAASSGANSDITSITGLTTALSIGQGGTGATTAGDARTALGLGGLATLSAITTSEITDGTIANADISGSAAIDQSKIADLTSDLSTLSTGIAGREAAIAAGTTAQYWRGDKSWQTLDTSIVAENTNLYFTDARARAAVSGTAPLSYNSGTGAFSMAAATSVANGYLSSGDWLTFNSKQAAISAASTVNTGSLTTALQSGLELKPFGTDPGETGEIRFNELVANGSEYVGFKAPNAITATRIWTLPAADGSTGQVLSTNGTGTLTWISPGGGGTVTSITAGTGLNGGAITGAGTIDLADTAVSAGSYTRANITVDAQGRLTAAANGSSVNLASEVTGTLPLANGGTGATTAADARTGLGLGALATASSVNLATQVSGSLPLANGGTGATTAALARTSLGLGGLATLSTVTTSEITDATIANADISASAAIADTKLDTIATAGKVSNSATTASSSNTNNAIVARDASGNFSAGTITANLSGNATTATTATTAGSVSGTVAIANGGTGATTAALARTGLGLGSLATASSVDLATSVTGALPTTNGGTGATTTAAARTNLGLGDLATLNAVGSSEITDLSIANADISAGAAIVDTKLATIATAGKVSNSATTATNANTASAIVARDASGNFSAGTITAALSGNATTATTAGSVSGVVGLANGGTGATTAALARTALGLGSLATASTIVNADVDAAAGIVDTKLATISTAGKVANSATTATNANTASAIVARDASGNFSAGTITAALSGNATTATTAGSVSGVVGLANGGTGATTAALARTALGLGSLATASTVANADIAAAAGIVDTKLATISTAGKVSNSATTATNANTASAIVARDASGNFSAGTITATLSGNASTATTAGSVTGTVAIANGGTGATTAALARTALGLGSLATASNVDLTTSVTGALPLANGGTGATTAALARTALGLGSLATLSAVGASEITDGTIANGDISASAAIVDTKLATIATAGKVSNSATTATSTNTASAIVARDGSGVVKVGDLFTTKVTTDAASLILQKGNSYFDFTDTYASYTSPSHFLKTKDYEYTSTLQLTSSGTYLNSPQAVVTNNDSYVHLTSTNAVMAYKVNETGTGSVLVDATGIKLNTPQNLDAVGAYVKFESSGNMDFNTTSGTTNFNGQNIHSTATANLTTNANYMAHIATGTVELRGAYVKLSNYSGATPILTTNSSTLRAGIGTDAPADKLQVVGDIRVGTSGSNGCLKGFGGTALSGSCSSDERFKKDITPLPRVLERLVLIEPAHYHWRAEEFPHKSFGADLQLGLIAQQVLTTMPELVSKDEDGYYQVRYHDLQFYILAGLRELKEEKDAEIAQLQAALETEKDEKSAMQAQLESLNSFLCQKFPDAPNCKP